MSEFVPGLLLSERYYEEAVRPILDRNFPRLQYAAGLIGSGSEVLGYDTAISTDHHWGPRLLLFLGEQDHAALLAEIDEALRRELPYTFMGYSTNFGSPDDKGVRLLEDMTSGPVAHMVELTTVGAFFKSYLGYDPAAVLTPADWLTFPEHRLLGSTGGKVFHDEPGELSAVRVRLAYYPDDIWLCLMAAEWRLIAEGEAFMGRTGEVGDEIGSRVIAARLVRYLMRLCFLMERRYVPYSKWFGTAFSRLDCAVVLTALLEEALTGRNWREREAALSEAYRAVARMHNRLGITKPLDIEVVSYYERPYRVLFADRFGAELRRLVAGNRVLEIASTIGSVNQFLDSTPVGDDLGLLGRLKSLYE
jgi:branched-subunit amino acid transport protein